MGAPADSRWSLERVRNVTLRTAAALAAIDPANAERLEAAAGVTATDAEALLLMRSALIVSRGSWESMASPALVGEARAAVAAGKRLAIDLD